MNNIPEVILFDVNETLLDINSMKASISEVLDGRDDLVPLWFTTLLHYSLVDTVTDNYHGFSEIAVAALQMVAKQAGIAISHDRAEKAVIIPMRSLPPHADVKSSLQLLNDAGYRLACFTNSSSNSVSAQMDNAGLAQLFERQLSVDTVRLYKPHVHAYQWALGEMGVTPDSALMVAAHAWDVTGAKIAGLQTAFIARTGKSLYPLGPAVNLNTTDLTGLAEILIAMKRSR